MSSITISRALIAPVREALYGALAENADKLAGTLWLPERHRSCQPWAACARLRRVASLLDQIGWREQDSRENVSPADWRTLRHAAVERDESTANYIGKLLAREAQQVRR